MYGYFDVSTRCRLLTDAHLRQHRMLLWRTIHHYRLRPAATPCCKIWKTLDSRLTLREACRICATVTGFVAIIAEGGGERAGKDRPPSRRDQGYGLAGQARKEEGEEERLLAVGDESMGPEEFARAVYHCGDLKTWDGMCSVSQVFVACRSSLATELWCTWPEVRKQVL